MQHPAVVPLSPCDGPRPGPRAVPWCPHAQSQGRLHFLHELLPQDVCTSVAPRPEGANGPLRWVPAVLAGRRQEGWSRAPSGRGGCAGGRCTDTLLRRHALVLEPGEGLQPAGRLLPALPGSAPGPVSACTAVAKLTPLCMERGAGAGCSLRCKGISSAGELPGGMAAHPEPCAGARPGHPLSLGLPEQRRHSRRCGGPRIPLGGCCPPTPPHLRRPHWSSQQLTARISPVFPQRPRCWRNKSLSRLWRGT